MKRGAAGAASTAADAVDKKKKKAATAAAADAGIQKSPGDWMRSTMTKAGLQQLRQKGLLPPEEEPQAHAPSNKEVFPEPRSNERVCFAEFLPRGFLFPCMISFVG